MPARLAAGILLLACAPATAWAVSAADIKQRQGLVLTDTIAPTEAVRSARNIRVVTIAPLIGEAIARIYKEESVSSLFD